MIATVASMVPPRPYVAEATARGFRIVGADTAGQEQVAALLVAAIADDEAIVATVEKVRGNGWHGPLMLLVEGDDGAAVAVALDAGADDATLASASPAEVTARLAALLRSAPAPVVGIGELVIDRLTRRVTRAGRPVDLLPREYALLLHLAQHAGQCVSRPALLHAVWGLRFDPGTNVVAVHISRLRAKLDRGYPMPMLRTEKGKGYRLAGFDAA